MKRLAIDFGEGARLDEELTERGVRFSALELRFPEKLAKQDWAAIGRRLCRLEQVTKWWLGDWAAFGLSEYGDLKEFAEMNGVDYGYLRNLAWVSQSVELSRRRDNVQWSKHQEVAPLPPKEQKQWLAKAEKEELSVVEMRRQIRQAKGENNALESDGPIIKFASKACDDLVNWIRTRPEGFWNEERRAAWKLRVKPIAEFYESL